VCVCGGGEVVVRKEGERVEKSRVGWSRGEESLPFSLSIENYMDLIKGI
jgi:hypothetical protein